MRFFLFVLLVSGTINAQTILFEDGFESYPDFSIDHVGNWTMLDLDGEVPLAIGNWENSTNPQAFIIFNYLVAATDNLYIQLANNYRPRTGNKYAACWRNKNKTKANNDWLISPKVLLGTSSNQLRFWTRDYSIKYGQEDYEIAVYRGDGNPTATSDFEIIEGNAHEIGWSTFDEWRERIFNLDAYAGETIRIGIHYCSKNKQYLMIDDFKVTTGTSLSTTDFFTNNFSVFPNPANDVLNISAKNGMEIKGIQITDLNGRIVKSSVIQAQTNGQINIADLTTGAYLISVQTNKGVATSKFLKN